ncbi:hypothetical protein BJF85_19730 [Saccharomonospora sp. CUA-673]|uniref:endonuclease domain-containing protein n=1 Tax=Saccharomonospora sp. CUA-673 TaxID=1904969 RepID=UPI000960192E|nr:DUF559 domain-containing protein [Saccharomonospora sp. CUA-673]OLT44706.1 hypothetical protein BJF85_19730 [Saccharomonospora sp. CUA-673]
MTKLPRSVHGAYLRAELLEVLGRGGMRIVLDEGTLVSASRTVVVEADRATDFMTRVAAFQLTIGPSSVVAGESALRVYGCDAGSASPVHLLVPPECKARNRPGLLMQRGSYETQDVADVNGLRVLTPDAAVAEVLRRSPPRTALACADQAIRMLNESDRLAFRALVDARISTATSGRGRRQARRLYQLAHGLAESPAESAMLLTVVDGGFPIPGQQYSVTDLTGREVYRLDFAWPELLVALEYDGYAAHEHRRERDAARDEDLRRRGWIVVRARADDLVEPSRVLTQLTQAFRKRGFDIGTQRSRAAVQISPG